MGKRWKAFFSFLVSAALFAPFVIILENKSEALCKKPLILRVQLAIRKSYTENIDPQKIMDGIFLEKWGIWTIKNGNLYLLSKSLYTKTIFCFDVKI